MRTLAKFLTAFVMFAMLIGMAVSSVSAEPRFARNESLNSDEKRNYVSIDGICDPEKMRSVINLEGCNFADNVKSDNGCIIIVDKSE